MDFFWLIVVAALFLFGSLGWSLYKQEHEIEHSDSISDSSAPLTSSNFDYAQRAKGWLIGVVGFVIGCLIAVAFEVLLIGIANEVFDARFVPRGLGWIIFIGVGGIMCARLARSMAEQNPMTSSIAEFVREAPDRSTTFLASIGRSEAWRGAAILAIIVVSVVVLAIVLS
ncbi:MAG: hypothetical protein H5U13_00490 [Parvibaculum sp.]|jgi:hypothetical protein|nr:hypothetical protein [Parvibaculum sp.]